jgi:hypothetical protein
VYEIMSVCMTWDVCLVKTKVRQQFLKFWNRPFKATIFQRGGLSI